MPPTKRTIRRSTPTRGSGPRPHTKPPNLCTLKQVMSEKLIERFGPLPDAVHDTMMSIGFYFCDRLGHAGKTCAIASPNQPTVTEQSLQHVLDEFQKLTQSSLLPRPTAFTQGRRLPDLLKSSLAANCAPDPLLHHRLIDILTIHQVLDQLERARPDWSLTLQLRYFSKLTLQEISRELSLSIQQVRTQLQKGEEWMRRYLSSDGTPATGIQAVRRPSAAAGKARISAKVKVDG